MKQQLLPTRALHLIDIENLSQTMILTEELVTEVKHEYFLATRPNPEDIFVVGVSHFNLAAASFGWGSGTAQYLVRSGDDGADLALLELLSTPSTLKRFNKVVIASGDGIFFQSSQMLAKRGIETSYVARQDCVARTIFLSGCECLLLPQLTDYDLNLMPSFAKEYALVS